MLLITYLQINTAINNNNISSNIKEKISALYKLLRGKQKVVTESTSYLLRALNSICLYLNSNKMDAARKHITETFNFNKYVKENEMVNYQEVKKAFEELKEEIDKSPSDTQINMDSSNLTFGADNSSYYDINNNQENFKMFTNETET